MLSNTEATQLFCYLQMLAVKLLIIRNGWIKMCILWN